jgi:hypothetical protein
MYLELNIRAGVRLKIKYVLTKIHSITHFTYIIFYFDVHIGPLRNFS